MMSLDSEIESFSLDATSRIGLISNIPNGKLNAFLPDNQFEKRQPGQLEYILRYRQILSIS